MQADYLCPERVFRVSPLEKLRILVRIGNKGGMVPSHLNGAGSGRTPMSHNLPNKISLNKLLAASEQALRDDHPNPNREGCPERAVLEQLADFSTDDSPFDPAVLQHIAECFPCFNELRQLRSLKER
jgi:hypothetical protein